MTYKINEQEGDFIKKWFPIFGVGYCRDKLKKTTSQIEAYALKHNIKANKNYKCNIEDYIDINTPEIIYTLGFLWADGSIGKMSKNSYLISVTVTESDSTYLEKVLDKWGEFKWRTYNIPAKKRVCKGVEINAKPSKNFYLSDRYLSNFLIENDYKIKSGCSADKILSKIPDHLKHYWWRGYFDGDGCFYYNKTEHKVQFYSVFDQDWAFIMQLCNKLNIEYSIYKQQNKIGKGSTFNIVRKNDCIVLLNYIYQNMESDNIGYSRKYQKYIESNLQLIEKTSKYKGVCYDKSKSINPWVFYYKGKYLGCSDSQEKALELRENYMKNATIIN